VEGFTLKIPGVALRVSLVVSLVGLVAPLAGPALGFTLGGFTLGDAANYVVMYEGSGGHTLHITNVTVDGNIGVGGTGRVADSGPSTIVGQLDFSAANTGQFSGAPGDVGPTSIHYGVTQVQTDLHELNSLSSMLGAETGAPLVINVGNGATQVINASSGTLDSSGNRVFNVTSIHFVNGATLQINGDGHNVVFNVGFNNPQFQGSIVLGGGLTTDQVLWNAFGGDTTTLTGGPNLQLNDNHAAVSLKGVFLDPNGTISVVNTTIDGRVFGGDSQDMQIVSGDTLRPTVLVPEPASLLLLAAGLFGIGALLRR
jgi:PEP-CTERM motif-containing protein